MEFILYYLYIALTYIVISGMFTGFMLEKWTFNHIKDGLFWFISIPTVIGMCIRTIYELFNKRKKT